MKFQDKIDLLFHWVRVPPMHVYEYYSQLAVHLHWPFSYLESLPLLNENKDLSAIKKVIWIEEQFCINLILFWGLIVILFIFNARTGQRVEQIWRILWAQPINWFFSRISRTFQLRHGLASQCRSTSKMAAHKAARGADAMEAPPHHAIVVHRPHLWIA